MHEQTLASFAASFGSAVIVNSQEESWVARKGEFCVFAALSRLFPEVRHVHGLKN